MKTDIISLVKRSVFARFIFGGEARGGTEWGCDALSMCVPVSYALWARGAGRGEGAEAAKDGGA